MPPHYKVDGTTVTASSAGGSTSDEYLLTREPLTDFVLTLDARRLSAVGPQPRAILVWQVDDADPRNRRALFIQGLFREADRTYRLRLVVTGARTALYCDGELQHLTPVSYGTPPATGGVGLLHYYNYDYRYESVDVTPLDPARMPAPVGLSAEASRSGCVRLTWRPPAALGDMPVGYAIQRTAGTDGSATTVFVPGPTFVDRTCRHGETVTYRAAVSLDGKATGAFSAPARVTVSKTAPPAPVRLGKAARRIDGSVALEWQLTDDSRAAGFTVLTADTPITARSADSARVLAAALAPTTTAFTTPPDSGAFVAVLVHDPDGRKDSLAAIEPRPAAPAPTPSHPWPTRHPMLLYGWDQVLAARQRLAQDEAARKRADTVCRSADATIRTPPAIPAEPEDAHPLIAKTQDTAMAYLLSGDERYAQWVRSVVAGYAVVYPNFEVRGSGRVRMIKTASGLYEVVKIVPLLLAYDMTYDSPAYSAADHVTIARDLLRPAAELFRVRDYANPADYRAQDLHYKCYNFQAWFIAATGMIGLLLRDADLVDHAIDGPYGFKHLLAHDLHDDGVFWERSFGYHRFVLTALLPFIEAARHCNLDLWNLQVPDGDETDVLDLANYSVGDGDNGPKSIRLMVDAPFYATFGDLTYAQVADSDRGPLRAGALYATAWARYADLKYAWLLNRNRRQPEAEPLVRGARDAGAEIRLAYDDANLYLAADVTDDVVTNTHTDPGSAWAGDLLWMGLKWSASRGGPYDFIYGLTPGNLKDVPPLPVLFNRFGANWGQRSACRYAVKRTADGYAIEAAFPLAEFAPRDQEPGPALVPRDGLRGAVDFCVYDCDDTTKPSTKEKMVAWACTTDRYDSSQGGTLVFGPAAGLEGKALNVLRVGTPPVIDGDRGDWQGLAATPARILPGATVMTDAGTAGPDTQSLFQPGPAPDEGRFDLRGTGFGNNGRLQAGCSLFPSTGFAILRERLDADGRPPADATCVTLNAGPHGGGHGHSDKLSIVLYADGKHWFPDFGSCAYESKEKGTWTAQTVSHNTVTVDGVSQRPTGAADVTWPCDSAKNQTGSRIDLFKCGPILKAASGVNALAYAGVAMRRTVVLVRDVFFDFYELESRDEHRYDYVLHIDGPLAESSVPPAPVPGPLGTQCGYQHIGDVARADLAGPVDTTWGEGERRLQVSLGAGRGDQFFTGRAMTSNPANLMPLLILRRQARRTVFGAVAKPLRWEAPAQVEWLSGLPEGVLAARVRQAGEDILMVGNATGARVRVDGFAVAGRTGARISPAGGRTLTATAP